jgi:hypothetical protein
VLAVPAPEERPQFAFFIPKARNPGIRYGRNTTTPTVWRSLEVALAPPMADSMVVPTLPDLFAVCLRGLTWRLAYLKPKRHIDSALADSKNKMPLSVTRESGRTASDRYDATLLRRPTAARNSR